MSLSLRPGRIVTFYIAMSVHESDVLWLKKTVITHFTAPLLSESFMASVDQMGHKW
jgi:hypothetical protein